ncbi:MAG: oligoribonuclease, partial [Candidatus Nomurabacteria bacterium]|nr:oligoribonuclease [Candidatus Nomurabacteria bacterium]
MKKKAVLLWVDLEMTGLDPVKDRILEVAAVATGWDLATVAKYSQAVKVAPELMERRMQGAFWKKYARVRQSLIEQSRSGAGRRVVERELVAWVKKYFGNTVYLAGNSVYQDRKFIEREWPELNKILHYRMLDVSAWKVYFEGARGKKFMKI